MTICVQRLCARMVEIRSWFSSLLPVAELLLWTDWWSIIEHPWQGHLRCFKVMLLLLPLLLTDPLIDLLSDCLPSLCVRRNLSLSVCCDCEKIETISGSVTDYSRWRTAVDQQAVARAATASTVKEILACSLSRNKPTSQPIPVSPSALHGLQIGRIASLPARLPTFCLYPLPCYFFLSHCSTVYCSNLLSDA